MKNDRIISYNKIGGLLVIEEEREKWKKESLGLLFRHIHNTFEMSFNKQLKSIGITASQAEILRFLGRTTKKEIKQRDIEKSLNLKNPTVTGILKRLEENGFVEIKMNEKDKRANNIYLTQKAIQNQKKMEEERYEMDSNLIKGMTMQEVEELRRLLQLVLENQRRYISQKVERK